MKRVLIFLILLFFVVIPVCASEYEPPVVPDSGEEFMPEEPESFGEGLWFIVSKAGSVVIPEIKDTASTCIAVFAVMLLASVVDGFSGKSSNAVHLVSSVMVGLLLLEPANTLIQMGTATITQMWEYGKLLIPVLTGALAAQGGVTSSSALYMTTVFFCTVLVSLIVRILIPMLYVYFCMSLVSSATGNQMIQNLQNFFKWLITWCLKILLYIFTGFIGITGVVSGSADASAVKAMKLTLSGMIPVVGGIISDASETILVGAGVMKNSTGIYGMLSIISVFIGPFLKIGCQYMLLKLTGSICGVFAGKSESALLKSFSAGMGMLLGMTGTVCLFLIIAIVCFLKGVS